MASEFVLKIPSNFKTENPKWPPMKMHDNSRHKSRAQKQWNNRGRQTIMEKAKSDPASMNMHINEQAAEI